MKSKKDDFCLSEGLSHIVLDFQQMKKFCQDPLVMARAEGVWYEDVNGKSYLDGIGGIFVATLGHRNRRVIDAMKQQLEEITFAPPLHGTNIRAVELAQLVASITPGDLNTVKLLSGGSEATEAAMKLARQYHRQTGNPTKYKVIGRYFGYHGATMGALSASALGSRKAIFQPGLEGYIHVFPPTCYRCPFGREYPECAIRCATIIDDVIKQEGPDSVASVILEPIGNTGGIITPPAEYLPVIRDICTRNNVLLIFDEIITAFGRTGNMFAAQTFNAIPDILCMGKGMSGGYAPLAAIAFTDKVRSAFWGDDDSIAFAHGHTYGANPLSSVAGIVCIQEILERKLCERAVSLGNRLRKNLEPLRALGIIGEVRGKGFLVGLEFVKDCKTKERFGKEIRFGVGVGKTALKNGLIIRFDPDWVAFAPPLIMADEEVDIMVDIFEQSVKEEVEKL